jgi:multidrug resistance efflux pump
VKEGQVMAILEVSELSAQVQGAEASVRRARDAIRRSKSNMSRAESLHEATQLDYTHLQEAAQTRPGLVAQQELDNAEAKENEAEAQVSANGAAL